MPRSHPRTAAFTLLLLVPLAIAQGTPPTREPPRLGGDRPAWYALPADHDPATPMPLAIALHGYGSDRKKMLAEELPLLAAASEAGVLLVAPEGLVDPGGNRYWNGTDYCCDFAGSGVDDVAYLASLIEEAADVYAIDRSRIYLIGHSNGGFLAHRFACERSELVAAIVTVSGATWRDPERCGSPSQVAALFVHGTSDDVIRYQGREAGRRPGHASVEEGAARWAEIGGCAGEAVAGDALDLVSDLGGRETKVLTYSACSSGVSVAIWSIAGGGHVLHFTPWWGEAVIGWLLAQAKP